MCYRVSNRASTSDLTLRFNARFDDDLHVPYYHKSAFSRSELPIITAEDPHKFQFFQWGLIPHWHTNLEKAQAGMIQCANGRGEELKQKPSYRDAWKGGQRCLVPTTGFFESHTVKNPTGKGKSESIPYFISVNDEPIFALGGLYNVWADKATGELYSTFNVLTVEANPLMKRIHNSKERMPLIIPRSEESTWLSSDLKGDSALFLIKPYDGDMRGPYGK